MPTNLDDATPVYVTEHGPQSEADQSPWTDDERLPKPQPEPEYDLG